MKIQHNITAMNNNRQLSITTGVLAASTQKLSSGYRINKAADDAAGLSISEKMRKQIRGLSQASENAEDGISLVQTADGALAEVTDILQRMNELCVQAANGTNSKTDLSSIQDEIDQLKTEIDRVAVSTKFNEIYLLDGSIGIKSNTPNQSATTPVMTLSDVMALDGLKIIYTEETDDAGITQSGTGSTGLSGAAYDGLKAALQDSIVPQAIKASLATFPDTFGYLDQSSIGIGLYLYNDANSDTLASVKLGASAYVTPNGLVANYLSYKLSVNIATLKDSNTGAINLTGSIRDNLEVTIIHEMTHALMDEALTNGMLGYDGGNDFDDSFKFPHWFKEGMAQAAAGGCYDGNDWVNSTLGITSATSETAISQIIRGSYGLETGNNESQYGTGYLACMYLGYLAGGGGTVTQEKMRAGIDKILSEIKGDTTTTPKSLEDVITQYTGYGSIGAFERGFGSSNAEAHFVSELVNLVQNGTGGLVADFNTQSGILPDADVVPAISLFHLDINSDEVKNYYPQGYPVFAGGTVSSSGGNGTSAGNLPGGNGGVITHSVTDLGFLRLQIGADAENGMMLHIDAMDTKNIGIGELSVEEEDLATKGITLVACALQIVSAQRSTLGAYQNRLEHTVKNLDNVIENTTAAESQIRDTDMAKEMVRYSNSNILMQAGQSLLTQANQQNQGVLSLIA